MNEIYPDIDFEGLTEVSRKRTVLNAVTNYGQYGIVVLVGLILQAFIIRSVGRNEYALWPMVNTSLDFVALIPLGIGAGASRFIAHALGRKDIDEARQIVSSLFSALVVTAIIYLIITSVIALYFESIFDIPEGAFGIGPLAMFLAGIAGAVRLPFTIFTGGLQALQKYPIINTITALTNITKLLIIVSIFTIFYPSLIWVAAAAIFLSLAEGIATLIALKKVTPWLKISMKFFRWDVLRKVNNFSLLLLILTISELLYWNTDYIFINKLLDPAFATGYAAVVSFILMTRQITSLGYSVMLPSATIMHAQNDQPRIGRLIFRFNRNVAPFAVSILVFLMIFGKETLTVYIGEQYADYGILFVILGVGMICSMIQNSSGVVPTAHGKMGTVASMAILSALLNVGLTMYFILKMGWGLKGVAAGSAISLVLYRLVFFPVYTARLLEMRWIKFIWNSLLIPLLNSLPFAFIVFAFYNIGFGKNLAELVVVFLTAGAVQTGYMFILGFDNKERDTIKEKLQSFTNRKS